jgi:hypothetical protein
MIIEQNNCIYCGGTGELQREHVIPASYIGYRSYDSDRQWIVTACRTCNQLAGSKVFFSIPEKSKYILSRYKIKFKKVLSTPFWNESELRELDYTLRKSVEAGVEAKALLNLRLKHLMSVMEYDIDYLRPHWVDLWMQDEKRKQKKLLKKNKKKHI